MTGIPEVPCDQCPVCQGITFIQPEHCHVRTCKAGHRFPIGREVHRLRHKPATAPDDSLPAIERLRWALAFGLCHEGLAGARGSLKEAQHLLKEVHRELEADKARWQAEELELFASGIREANDEGATADLYGMARLLDTRAEQLRRQAEEGNDE